MNGKRILALMLALVMMLALTACGAKQEESSPAAAPATENKTEADAAPAAEAAAEPATEKNWDGLELVMFSASPGGTWYAVGVGMAEIIMREIPGLTVIVEAGGSQANIKALQNGEAELAMLYSADMPLAWNGEEPFEGAMDKMRDLIMLYDSPYQVTVRQSSGIETFQDLKGHTLGTVQMGTGGEFMNRTILNAMGITYDDVNIQYSTNSELIELMKDKHIDASANVGGAPYPLTMEIGSTEPIRVLSMTPEEQEMISAINPGYTPYTIPAGTYSDYGMDDEVITLSMTTRLACSADLDEDLVYLIVKAIAEHLDEMEAIVADMTGKQPADMYQDIDVPFHDGALRFYKEIGVVS